MPRETTAGPCLNGGRHKWGNETNRRAGVYSTHYDEPCLKCARVRVREYTKRGNHVAGYFTRSP